MAEFGRLITAMVTPMHINGEVNYAQARKLARALVSTGSDGLLVGGTTGEAPSMSNSEKLRLFGEIKDEVGAGTAVIAGTTDNNHHQSVELTREAERIGVDGILCTVPAYNKPQQEGLYRHFKAISDATALPCMLYNVPSRTALNLEPDTTLRLSKIDNIIGIKEASSDLNQIARIIDDSPSGFLVWSGNDDQTFPIMCLGGYGVVSVASNIIGNQIKAMVRSILEGKVESAAAEHRRLLPLVKALFWVTSPVPIKLAMNHAGVPVGPTRLPLVEPDDVFGAKFAALISNYEIDIISQ